MTITKAERALLRRDVKSARNADVLSLLDALDEMEAERDLALCDLKCSLARTEDIRAERDEARAERDVLKAKVEKLTAALGAVFDDLNGSYPNTLRMILAALADDAGGST